MNIRRMIYVPSDRIVIQKSMGMHASIKNILKNLLPETANLPMYDAEMLCCGDLSVILGASNIFTYGKYQPQYFRNKISKYCPYPSCCMTPKTTPIEESEFDNYIRKVDVILVSSRAGKRGFNAIKHARRHDIPIAIIDVQDHELIYGSHEIRKFLTREYKLKEHFDIYFKKDLPIGFKSDVVIPLAPTPVRPEAHSFDNLNKEYDIFYSGRKRETRCQDDRSQMVELVKNNFNNVKFHEHESRKSFLPIREYWSNIARSHITLSPSGRSWDSFRHCEVGLTGTTVLLAPKPYIETIGPALIDSENAILYDTKIKDGRYHIINEQEILEKIENYLKNRTKMQEIAKKWNKDVINGHSIKARSKYIIEVMENAF